MNNFDISVGFHFRFRIGEMAYTGAPLLGTPILGTPYIVSCDAEVCGAERESSRMIQGRMH